MTDPCERQSPEDGSHPNTGPNNQERPLKGHTRNVVAEKNSGLELPTSDVAGTVSGGSSLEAAPRDNEKENIATYTPMSDTPMSDMPMSDTPMSDTQKLSIADTQFDKLSSDLHETTHGVVTETADVVDCAEQCNLIDDNNELNNTDCSSTHSDLLATSGSVDNATTGDVETFATDRQSSVALNTSAPSETLSAVAGNKLVSKRASPGRVTS